MTIRELAETLYPDRAVFNIQQSATLLGISPQTAYNNKAEFPLGRWNTLEQIIKIAERRTRESSSSRKTQTPKRHTL